MNYNTLYVFFPEKERLSMEENKTRQELREEQLQSQAPRRKRKRKSVGELILLDLLLIARWCTM